MDAIEDFDDVINAISQLEEKQITDVDQIKSILKDTADLIENLNGRLARIESRLGMDSEPESYYGEGPPK